MAGSEAKDLCWILEWVGASVKVSGKVLYRIITEWFWWWIEMRRMRCDGQRSERRGCQWSRQDVHKAKFLWRWRVVVLHYCKERNSRLNVGSKGERRVKEKDRAFLSSGRTVTFSLVMESMPKVAAMVLMRSPGQYAQIKHRRGWPYSGKAEQECLLCDDGMSKKAGRKNNGLWLFPFTTGFTFSLGHTNFLMFFISSWVLYFWWSKEKYRPLLCCFVVASAVPLQEGKDSCSILQCCFLCKKGHLSCQETKVASSLFGLQSFRRI